MTIFKLLLKELKKELEKHPFDAGHDYLHHKEVWKNSIFIIKEEKLKLDSEALEIAAMWHDYERSNEEKNRRMLWKIAKNISSDENLIKNAIYIMSAHSFGTGQESPEQKVLFDADKLEYVGIKRLKRVASAVENGKMPLIVLEKYKKTFNDRIPSIYDQLHFSSSKIEFNKRKELLKEFASNNKFWNGVVLD